MSFGIADLFDHAEESVAGVVDHHVESPEVQMGRIDRRDRRGVVRDVEGERKNQVAVPVGKVSESVDIASGRCHPVAPVERGNCPLSAEPSRRSGDEPDL